MKAAGYLGPSGPPESMQLWESFKVTCREEGLPNFHCHAINGTVLKNFLHVLPRPAGILCATDRLARAAIQGAREAEFGIPEDLAVIGVGNSRIESVHAGMTISSFELPMDEIGRRAGSIMADLLGGKSRDGLGRSTVTAILHERESSLRSASPLDRVLAHLRSHPDTPMSAGELARFAGMSRRSFEIAVRDGCNCSPGELLRRMRQARAEGLLRESDMGIALIGRECGYTEPALFSAAFRRWTGKSPREFRDRSLAQKLA
jgi:AraC-like DNA-binding protein